MSSPKVFLSIDLGASSGRVMAGVWNGSNLALEVVHRFPSPAVLIPPYHYWDILGIYHSILDGLNKAQQTYGEQIVSIAVDTWGVDYGLIDERGELLSNPIQYRDTRSHAAFERVPKELGRETIYAETGVQFLPFNTLFQLVAEKEDQRPVFPHARHLLFMPDLVNYWLTGKKIQERTVASTSQLLNPQRGAWSEKLIETLDLPPALFGPITEPGTVLGGLREDLVESLRLPNAQVVAVCGHDTASAVAATPFATPRSAFLSSGTWSIMGQELPQPITSKAALDAGFSNELGYRGTIRFLRNICGMWLIEESRRQWIKEGTTYTYDEMADMTCNETPRRAFIDPDAPDFVTAGDLPSRIRDYCQRTGQPVPETPAQILRVAFDSMVMKYRHVFKNLEALNGATIDRLHIVGGGVRNDFLNQMTADALGVPVEAGPVEATSLGNLAVQMITEGVLPDIAAARAMIRDSYPPICLEPKETALWEAEDDRFNQLLS